ncbi:MAG: hypothetical protein QM778_08035 [Myxococcales bacterium]
MRKLGWIVLLALAAGCGGDDHKAKRPDGGSADGGGDGDGPGCGIEIPVYPGYTDPLVWSEANLAACNAACPGLQSTDCIQANCPGAADFFTCLDEELYACQTSPGHDCYREYGEWNCCAFENCGDQQGDSQVRACLQQNCSTENNTVEECYTADQTSPGFVACRDAAYDNCLGTDSGGTCTPADADPISGYEDARPWTKTYSSDDYDACIAMCKGQPNQAVCMNSKCPGAPEYRECIVEETAACTTQAGGECRGAWETVFCCARTKCGGATTSSQLDACLQSACKTEYDAFNTCDTGSREGPCKAPAEAACVVQPATDGGVPDGGPSAKARVSSEGVNATLLRSLRSRSDLRGAGLRSLPKSFFELMAPRKAPLESSSR